MTAPYRIGSMGFLTQGGELAQGLKLPDACLRYYRPYIAMDLYSGCQFARRNTTSRSLARLDRQQTQDPPNVGMSWLNIRE